MRVTKWILILLIFCGSSSIVSAEIPAFLKEDNAYSMQVGGSWMDVVVKEIDEKSGWIFVEVKEIRDFPSSMWIDLSQVPMIWNVE